MTKRLREILVIERDRAVENKEEFIQVWKLISFKNLYKIFSEI